MLKKLSAILLTVGLFMQTEITVLASEIDVESIITVEDNENIETPGLGYIEPEEYDASSVCWENKYQLLGSSPQVAQSYYKTELLPEIRHQGSYGTCWAFATLGCMEINLMKKGYTDVDLSELHLAYFTYHSATDPLGGLQGDEYSYANTTTSFLQIGGNEVYASNALMDWLGAASEKTVPYSQAATVAKDGLADELAFEDVAHLQGVRKINMSDTGDVKQAIVEYGAVQISYHAISSYNSNAYYNADTAGYYCYDENGTNHAVIIVGWDDNYAASKFPTQPSGNGAWIVRNSWGSGYGEGGYFYLSYYDKSLSDVAVAFEAEMSDNYDNNYQYDGSPIVGYLSYAPVKLANVFQAKANEGGLELLEAVSFQTMNANCNYTINIYKNLTDMGNPESGLLCDTMSGQTTYEGIYTIPLNEEVYLEQNAYYSVVIDLTSENEDKLKIPLDMADTNNLYNASSVAKEQQSFWWYYGSWQDFGKQYGGNLKIKAYTTNADIQETIFVTGISLYPIVADINVGQTLELSVVVTPENATHKELVWSSSDENIAIVDENGLVEAKKVGTATITAKATDGSNVTTCCQVNVKQPMTGIELNKTAVEINMNGSEQLTVTYLPTDTTDDKTVTWKSMDETVATVTQNGLIKPVAPGTTTITAQVGSFSAQATICVKPIPVTGVEIKGGQDTLNVGETMQLSAKVLPADATYKSVQWESDKESVAIVNEAGKVTAMAPGTAVITVTTVDGSKTATWNVTVKQPMTGIELNKTAVEINMNGSEQLMVTYLPADTTDDKTVTWKSMDKTVATVTQNGLVEPVAPGTTTITAQVGSFSAQATICVKPIPVTGVEIKGGQDTLNVGETMQLSAKVLPVDATYKSVQWESDKESVAIVNEAGKVTAMAPGTAVITVTTVDGSKTATWNVTVKQPMTGIELNKTAVEINMNGSEQLTVTYLPTDTTDDKTVTWKSMDETVATVTQNGLIKPVAPGTATIVATVGEFTARAEVKIKPVLVTGLEIKTDKNTIEVGEKIQLLVNVLPVDATNKAIVWYSFDETIATVDDNGNVTGIKAGQTVISATAQGGDASKILTITVVQKTEEDDSESTKEPEDIVKPEEPGDSVDKDESGDSDTSDDKDETGDSDTPGNKDETGDSDTPGNKDEIGDSDTSVDKNETEDSNTSDNTDNQTGSGTPVLDGMVTESDGKRYWYEDGIKQGLEGRGKEIYDSERGAWYWLDSVLDGAVATSKDVYQESAAGEWADNADGTGKWVRYDENGHMIKGWQTTENGTYYFDKIYGTMAKGSVVIDGIPCYFDPNTGIAANGQWITIDGVPYWYENGVRQGLEGRGKEIYDATTNAWYWLDSVDMGKKAVSKDVYQESLSAYPDREDGTGKWVRYDENGHMVKGWQTTEQGIYYFEEITGAMAKGQVTIDGKEYNFDETTGLLK